MPKEPETYRETLASLRERGEALGLPPVLLTSAQLGKLLGFTSRWIQYKRNYYRFTGTHTTYEKVAMVISRDGD